LVIQRTQGQLTKVKRGDLRDTEDRGNRMRMVWTLIVVVTVLTGWVVFDPINQAEGPFGKITKALKKANK